MPTWITETITGNIVYPQTWESSRLLVRVVSSIPPVWRKSGYLRIEVLIEGEYFTVDYLPIDFGNNLVSVNVPDYRLSFEPVNNLPVIYPNTTISIYQLTPSEVRNIKMSQSYDPGNRAVGPSSEVTIPAGGGNIPLVPANLLRSPNGVITNNSNKALWVTFKGVPAVPAPPCKKVLANGGNIDIPGGYTGVINGIWEPGATGSCVVDEFTYI
jgi:hypothetical protein